MAEIDAEIDDIKKVLQTYYVYIPAEHTNGGHVSIANGTIDQYHTLLNVSLCFIPSFALLFLLLNFISKGGTTSRSRKSVGHY